jgi:hypothetical protein
MSNVLADIFLIVQVIGLKAQNLDKRITFYLSRSGAEDPSLIDIDLEVRKKRISLNASM